MVLPKKSRHTNNTDVDETTTIFGITIPSSISLCGGSIISLLSTRQASSRKKAVVCFAIVMLWPLVLYMFVPSSSSNNNNNNDSLVVGSSSSFGGRKSTTTRNAGGGGVRHLFFDVGRILDRVDLLGYGPTHPRIGIVITTSTTTTSSTTTASGNSASSSSSSSSSDHSSTDIIIMNDIRRSVESIYKTTDMNRIFVICIIVDQHMKKDVRKQLKHTLQDIEMGTNIHHWHGTKPDIHNNNNDNSEDDDNNNTGGTGGTEEEEEDDEDDDDDDDSTRHGRKIQLFFNDIPRGIAESRMDGAEFISLLGKYHEDAGLKSQQEDIMLLLLESGVQLSSRRWLDRITSSLIVPPPTTFMEEDEEHDGHNKKIAMKMANAIAFNTILIEEDDDDDEENSSGGSSRSSTTTSSYSDNQRISFDGTFRQVISEANPSDLAMSNGDSYPTPTFGRHHNHIHHINNNGNSAIAMRLETYMNLPLQDITVSDPWYANIDLALNLWLCGDGIDILKDVQVHVHVVKTTTKTKKTKTTKTKSISQQQQQEQEQQQQLLSPTWIARFAAAWMDDNMSRKIYNVAFTIATTGMNKGNHFLTYLEWQTYINKARQDPTAFAAHSSSNHHPYYDIPTKKCRSFQWYTDNINTELGALLKEDQSSSMDKYANNNNNNNNNIKKKNDSESEQRQQVEVEQQQQQLILKKPSKPLCDECLSIVQKAKPVDITYVDVSNGHREHPHMGAKDEFGNYGYIHDPTFLHGNEPAFEFPNLHQACSRRDGNYKMLHDKVVVNMEAHNEAQRSGIPRAKIFCLVYTIEKSHNKIPYILQTWGTKCDGFMVGSTKTDRSIGAVEIPHEGPEEYNNIWQKVRSMWSYIYDNYYEDYDWFHIGGDDLYLIVENLRLYLESEEIQTAGNGGIFLPTTTTTINDDNSNTRKQQQQHQQTPLFLGRRFAYMGDMNDIFISGGSGYTINKASLKLAVTQGFPTLFPHLKTFSEDTMIARTLRHYGIYPYETKDEYGGERYMPFMPGHHYGYQMPADKSKDWYAKYSINIKFGLDHCAKYSVAFHYVKDDAMKRLHALLYGLCPSDTLVEQQ